MRFLGYIFVITIVGVVCYLVAKDQSDTFLSGWIAGVIAVTIINIVRMLLQDDD